MISALDFLLHNAHRGYLAERDLGLGKATRWRAIVLQDVEAVARDMGWTPPAPDVPISLAGALTCSATEEDGWRPSEDWQLAAANDRTLIDT